MSRRNLYILLAVLLLLFTLADLALGSTIIPFDDLMAIISGNEASKSTWEIIFFQFRLPRVLTAIVVGAGLAISGLLMQVLFRNPLAGPYVLGISTGASLGVAIAVLTGIGFGLSWLNSWFTVLSATLGALMVFSIVLLASFRVRDSTTLLIFGLMLGSATSGIVAILQFFSKAEDIQIYLLWTFGSLGGVSYEKLSLMAGTVGLGLLISLSMLKPLNALLLGEDYAQSMGVNLLRSRVLIIIATCLMAGAITAFAGPIAFVGIAVPHISRSILNTSEHRHIFPVSLILGAVVLLACDIISQLPGSVQVLPINAVTALFGGPLVIWIILRKGNIKRNLG